MGTGKYVLPKKHVGTFLWILQYIREPHLAQCVIVAVSQMTNINNKKWRNSLIVIWYNTVSAMREIATITTGERANHSLSKVVPRFIGTVLLYH